MVVSHESLYISGLVPFPHAPPPDEKLCVLRQDIYTYIYRHIEVERPPEGKFQTPELKKNLLIQQSSKPSRNEE